MVDPGTQAPAAGTRRERVQLGDQAAEVRTFLDTGLKTRRESAASAGGDQRQQVWYPPVSEEHPCAHSQSGRERFFDPEEIIVSKTDPNGRITYVNDVFIRVSGYAEEEVLGQPHSFIRHAGMPRAIFQLLWDELGNGKEVFAYVVNLSENGDHYWGFAHVTPTFGANGEVRGYHSNRRVPEPRPLAAIQSLYRSMLE